MKKHRIHSEKHLECGQCEKIFSTITLLNQHKNQVHVLKSFKCEKCKYRAKIISSLRKHINDVHTGIPHYNYTKCDFCDYQGRKYILKRHPFTKVRKIGFVKHVRIQHISRVISKNI